MRLKDRTDVIFINACDSQARAVEHAFMIQESWVNARKLIVRKNDKFPYHPWEIMEVVT